MIEKTVLIADDDFELTQTLAMRLRRLGVTVMRSPDASHALIGAMRVPPDFIVLDVDMPSGNGLAVCEMLAGDERCCHIPVVIHTGHSDRTTITRCGQLRARYVHKAPGSPAQIVKMICEALNIDVARALETTAEHQQASTPGNSGRSHATAGDAGETTAANTTATTTVSEQLGGDGNPRADVPGGTRRPTVLSIDDDPDVSKALQMKLKPHGIIVLRAFSGEQGYALAVEQKPDLIITDLVLPEAEGAYIVRRIRLNPSLRDIPIWVLTGQSYPTIKHQILSLGVDAFLTKPLSTPRLLRELRSCINFPDNNVQSQAAATVEQPDGLLEKWFQKL